MGHETPWNRSAAGKAAPTGHPAVKSGQESVGCGTGSKRFCELSLSLVPDVPNKGLAGTVPPTHSGKTTQTLQVPKEKTGKGALKGTPNRWIPHGSMDLKTGSRGDRATVWHSLSPLPCLETSSKPGLELPETGAPGFAKGRRADRPLEALPLAPYKKTPKGLGPIWSSSMSPAFCSFPTSRAPGHPRARLLSSTISTSRTEFLPSVLWRCLRKEDAWPFISSFAHAISPAWMSGPSSKACSGIFRGLWSCCGIGELSTGVKKSSNGSLNIQDFMWNIFQPTHRNLTRLNMFGIRPIALYPTVRRRTWQSLQGCSETLCGGYEDPKTSFGPVFMLPIYHGHGEPFHYLCKTQ